jgi:hypothetical protein
MQGLECGTALQISIWYVMLPVFVIPRQILRISLPILKPML